jgi:hypothetical protein
MASLESLTGIGLIAAALLAAAVTEGGATLTGTATYRERLLLPKDAVFEATLEDVSRADAPSTVLGRAAAHSPASRRSTCGEVASRRREVGSAISVPALPEPEAEGRQYPSMLAVVEEMAPVVFAAGAT